MPVVSELKIEFKRRIHAAFAEYGLQIEHLPILEEYQDRGVSRSAVWKWWDACKKEFANGETGLPKPRMTPGRKQPPPKAPKAAVADVLPKLPRIPTMEDVESQGLLPVLKLLRESIDTAQKIMIHARNGEGAVRNARLLLQGSEHLRRTVETAARLNESVAAQQEMQRFHAVVLEEIGGESPAVQERILNRIRRACDAAMNDG